MVPQKVDLIFREAPQLNETTDKRIEISEAKANDLVIMDNASIIINQGLDNQIFVNGCPVFTKADW
jgi:hypothetical protein